MVAPSAYQLAKKLLVVGGTGGVGLQVCKQAVARGWDVTSLSRRGKPSRPEVEMVGSAGWIEKVNWAKGDSLDPSTYQDKLDGTDAVVHSVGLLFENDYKQVLHQQSFSGMSNALAHIIQNQSQSQNPLMKRTESTASGTASQSDSSSNSQDENTYERVNRDTAIIMATNARKAGVKSFAYISAAFAPPLVPNRYITTKRQAETFLLTNSTPPTSSPSTTTSSPSQSNSESSSSSSSSPTMRPIIFRPGFLSTPNRPVTLPLAGLLQISSAVLGSSIQGTIPFAQAVSTPPLSMENLAKAVLSAIENEEVQGIVDVQGIQTLADGNVKDGSVGARK